MVLRLGLVLALASVSGTAAAQASLTGTYVDYVSVGPWGCMLGGMVTGEDCSVTGFCAGGGSCDFSTGQCTNTRSMAYREDVAGPPSCDAFFPGAPVETFTIQVEEGGALTTLTNQYTGGSFVGTDPTVVGREIRWSGEWRSGTSAIAIDQVHAYEPDDRFVRLTIQLTNTGSTTFPGLYYLRNADPDFGSCSIGGTTVTDNDVRRQPPADGSALVTAGSGDGLMPGRYLVLGIGAHDDRARAHAGGFNNTNASGEWAMPEDPGGLGGDIGQDVVFYEPGAFAPGATIDFEILYVWGTTAAEVEVRFDEAGSPSSPCGALPDGSACSVRGRAGTCRATRCCTGCWTGSRCVSGSGSACGAGGVLCVSCADGDLCTSDVCTAGACSNPDAPPGTSCDDGLFCTRTDTCDGAGTCGGTGATCDDGRSCTIDTCDDAADLCSNVMGRGCIIGGECVGEGLESPAYPCLYCDPDRSTTDWSRRASGTECGALRCDAGTLRLPGTCDSAGFCVAPAAMRCPTGACADATSCETPCTASSCAAGEYCDTATRRCMALGALGEACTTGARCASGACADGRCCSSACTGSCQACNVAGQEGTCAPVPDGTDPIAECGLGRLCDGMGACRSNRDAGPPPDAGADGGSVDSSGGLDAGAAVVDAGGSPPARGGCACGVIPAQRFPGVLVVLLALAGLRRRRKRRGGLQEP
jgi:hypothetical protein